jgi:hypothetical protein
VVSTTTIFLRTWMEAGGLETEADHGPGPKWSLSGTQAKGLDIHKVPTVSYLGLDFRRLQSVGGH